MSRTTSNSINLDNSSSSTNVQISTHNLALTNRRSAFSPYRPSTVLTNLQRGNIQTQTSSEPLFRNVHQLAALGELFLCNLDNSVVNDVDEMGFTPILWAAAYGQLTAINLLHEKGANIYFKGPNGENALILASSNDHTHVVKALLSLGFKVNETDEDGNSALMYAAYGGYKTCAKELLEHGADIFLENSNLDTAYSISIKRKHKEVQNIIERHISKLIIRN